MAPVSVTVCRPPDDPSAGTAGVDLASSSPSQHQEGVPNGTGQKGSKDSTGKKRDDTKPGPKKPKEKVDALSQFDLNNYASMSHVPFIHVLFTCLFVTHE